MVYRSEIKSRCPPSIGRFMANVRLSQMAPLGWSGPSVPVFVSHFWLTAPGWSQNCHLHLFFRHSQFPSTASTHWKHIHTKVFVSPQYWLMEIVYVTLCAGFKCNFCLKVIFGKAWKSVTFATEVMCSLMCVCLIDWWWAVDLSAGLHKN